MQFHRTVDSLFPLVQAVPITHEHTLASLLRRYEQQLEQASASGPDRSLLEQAQSLLQERLATTNLDSELLLLAMWIHSHMGAFRETITIVKRFLSCTHSPEEEAWARWHLVDNYALARCCIEAMREQKDLLQFALQHFSAGECLFVMYDGTQASCWEQNERGEEWLQIVQALLQQVEAHEANRMDRFYCLRTAAYVCLSLEQTSYAQEFIQAVAALADEDLSWAGNLRCRTEASILLIKLASDANDVQRIRAVGEEITHELTSKQPHEITTSIEAIRQYRMLCHNTAAPLYRAKQYDLAIPLFEQAIRYGAMPYDPYLWLAASLWATTHQTEKVFVLLRQAAQRYSDGEDPWQKFRRLPEFAAVRDDPSFQHAADSN
jgi:tetratricopeptide (TPR) repeat protein